MKNFDEDGNFIEPIPDVEEIEPKKVVPSIKYVFKKTTTENKDNL